VWHGSAAVAELCRRMEPSDQLCGRHNCHCFLAL
jgi:hypothetical protein